jgi:hypothetical protein
LAILNSGQPSAAIKLNKNPLAKISQILARFFAPIAIYLQEDHAMQTSSPLPPSSFSRHFSAALNFSPMRK